jgi:hypothetical protein
LTSNKLGGILNDNFEKGARRCRHGTGLAIVGTLLVLLGHLVSMKLRPKFWQFSDLKPRAFYASTIAITAFCWISLAVAFASGL